MATPSSGPASKSSSPPASPPAGAQVVVMGVAGCGKSEVGLLIAQQLGLPLIEGDDFHPPGNIRKMQQGTPLADEDRTGWLQVLGAQLAAHPRGVVLTCSALKADYRRTLRSATTNLKFVHLAITPEESLRRVGNRPGHFYPPSLVASQFQTLQDPAAEPGVLTLAGDATPAELARQAAAWLGGSAA